MITQNANERNCTCVPEYPYSETKLSTVFEVWSLCVLFILNVAGICKRQIIWSSKRQKANTKLFASLYNFTWWRYGGMNDCCCVYLYLVLVLMCACVCFILLHKKKRWWCMHMCVRALLALSTAQCMRAQAIDSRALTHAHTQNIGIHRLERIHQCDSPSS